MASDPNDDEKSWWDKNVETPTADFLDREREKLPEQYRDQNDFNVGVAKGAYHFGKGIVTGVADIVIYAVNVLALDADTLEKTWEVTKSLAKLSYIVQFGSPQEKSALNDQILKAGKHALDSVVKEWEDAKAKGKQKEFIGRYGVQGILEIASFLVGIGEVKAVTKASKGAEAVGVVSKCPKLLRAEKLAKEAEDAAEAARTARAAEAVKAAEALRAAAKEAGMTDEAAAAIAKIAKEENAVIVMRPTNKESLEWIKKGHPRKPEAIKAKTMTADDVALGAPKGKEGLVWHKEPILPPEPVDPKIRARYDKRMKEFKQNDAAMQELVRDGKITIAEDGTVIDKASGKEITGDHDIFEIKSADGKPMSPEQKERIVNKLKEEPVAAQHGAHMDWETKNAKEAGIKDGIIDGHKQKTSSGGEGEALVSFGPDGPGKTYAQ